MKKATALFVCLAALLSVALTGCESGGGEKTYTLTGTLAISNVNCSGIEVSNGHYSYLKLVAAGGTAADAPLYWGRSTAFAGNQATYSITGIAEGSYTGYAFIDADDDAAGDRTSMPDGDNDYVTDGGASITISGDQVFDLPSTSWVAVAS